MKKLFTLIILLSINLLPLLAQKEEKLAKEQQEEPKNELSIDVSSLFNFSKASTGILFKHHVWQQLALRARIGGSYITESEDLNPTIIQETALTHLIGAIGIEHAHHIEKFEFIYGFDFVMKNDKSVVQTTNLPNTNKTTTGYGLAPFIGISYHPNRTIVFGIEPESYFGSSHQKINDGITTDKTKGSEFFILESVTFYAGFTF